MQFFHMHALIITQLNTQRGLSEDVQSALCMLLPPPQYAVLQTLVALVSQTLSHIPQLKASIELYLCFLTTALQPVKLLNSVSQGNPSARLVCFPALTNPFLPGV